MKTVKIKNISDERQAVTGIPAFEADQVHEVTIEQSELLLVNPAFELVKAKKQSAEK